MKFDRKNLRAPLLTAIVFIAHALSGWLEAMVMAGNKAAWIYLFIWYTAFIWIGDKIINIILFLPCANCKRGK